MSTSHIEQQLYDMTQIADAALLENKILKKKYADGQTMNDLGHEIRQVNTNNGWNVTMLRNWQESEYKIPAILMLISSEVAEALEGFRNDDFENFREECADIIIRVLDLTAGLDIDIDDEVRKKIEINKQRGHKHGGKRI